MVTTKKSNAQVWREQPGQFYRDVLQSKLYDKQVAMLEAVRDHSQVAVGGANGTGKDYIAGRLIAWWLSTHYPALCVCLAPTQRQANIIWSELEIAHVEANRSSTQYSLGGRMLTNEWRVAPNHYAIQFSTDKPLSIQGYHSANLMVLVTEAHGLEQRYFDAIHRLQPHKLVLVGNPLCVDGEFFDAFHEKSHLWSTVQVSAFDTPNVREGREVIPGMITRQWVHDRAEDWGEDSPLYVAAVLGQFPDSLEDALISRASAVAASKRTAEAVGPVIISCDVARFGGDETVILQRQGSQVSILQTFRGADLMKTANYLKVIHDDLKPDHMVVDVVGIGAGIVDRLKELGVKTVAFSGGEAPRSTKGQQRFVNKVAEAWWAMREWFLSDEGDIPNDQLLISQVSSRKYEIQSDRKIKLESKVKMSKSPDRADALAMSFAPELTRSPPNVRFLPNYSEMQEMG